MPNNTKVKDILGKIKGPVRLKDFFDGKIKLDQHVHKLLQPSGQWEKENYLLILKRYNSFAPALPRLDPAEDANVKGGGLFLHWEGKGIAIDPGFNFIKNLSRVGLTIGNIDAVMITHGHNDHCADFDSILTLLYEFNDLTGNLCSGAKSAHQKDYTTALHHFKRALEIDSSDRIAHEGIKLCLHKLGKKIERDAMISKYADNIEKQNKKFSETPLERLHKKIDLFLSRNAQKRVESGTPLNLSQIRNLYILNPDTEAKHIPTYNFDLSFPTAKHPDIYSKCHSIGLKLILKDQNGEECMKVGITSDTGYYFMGEKIDYRRAIKEICDAYKDCKMIIANIGSMLEEELDWLTDTNFQNNESLLTYLYEKHLGILGLIKLISEMDPDILKLVVISEYGEEMGKYRKELTDFLNSTDGFKNNPVFRTGDIGLKVSLKDPIKIWANNYTSERDPKDIQEDDSTGEIIYKY